MSKQKASKVIDMTTGRPWEKILMFTLPMLIGNIAQQLYNTVDSIVVGKFVGDNALAAVGSAGPIFNLLLVLFIGIGTGATIVIAQYVGAKQREAVSFAVGNCIILVIIAAILMAAVGLPIARPLLELLNTPDSIIDWCHSYLMILFIGGIGLGAFNILSGVLRGLGDSVSPLIYLIVSTVINIALDIFFVAKLNLGVNGVALATVIAQTISAILCLIRLAQMKEMFDFKACYLVLKKQYAGSIVKLGLPAGITQMIMSMSMIIVQSLTNSFGEQLIAANVIVMRVDSFAMLPCFSFSSALTTYAGQNIGANQVKRVEQGAKEGLLLAGCISAFLVLLILLFGKQLMGIFTDTPELVTLANRLMRILAVGYIAMTITQGLVGIMRGAGDTVTVMWFSVIQTVFIRVPLAYLFVYLSKSEAYPQGRREMIFLSLLVTWLISMVIHVIYYRMGKWKNKGIIK